jgi:benzoyl-CoA reductase/2-hydroxyglutaryl-CoA dehydratase subunit BcrC/BadD/HgdB
MSEEEMEPIVTSPDLPVDEGVVHSVKEFSGAMTLEMTDDAISHALRVMMPIREKWINFFRRKFNDPTSFTLDDAMEAVEKFEDELKYELADKCNVLATVDTVPLLEGQPMRIEWLGQMPGSDIYRYGMDHEKKEWEVKRATERGEDYLGQGD